MWEDSSFILSSNSNRNQHISILFSFLSVSKFKSYMNMYHRKLHLLPSHFITLSLSFFSAPTLIKSHCLFSHGVARAVKNKSFPTRVTFLSCFTLDQNNIEFLVIRSFFIIFQWRSHKCRGGNGLDLGWIYISMSLEPFIFLEPNTGPLNNQACWVGL